MINVVKGLSIVQERDADLVVWGICGLSPVVIHFNNGLHCRATLNGAVLGGTE